MTQLLPNPVLMRSGSLRLAAAFLSFGVLTACGGDPTAPPLSHTAPSLSLTEVPTVVRPSPYPLVFATDNRGCTLMTDRLTRCWGWNVEGEVGDGTTVQRLVPTVVTGGINFVDLGIGIYHTCGLTTAGKAFCWGQNLGGELGDGTTTDRHSPVPVIGNDAFVQLVAGYWHTCGLTTAGETKCWGEFNVPPTGPTLVASPKFASLTHGNSHVCGLTREGKAYCWHTFVGGLYGQIGDGTNVYRPTPTPVIGDLKFTRLSAGGAHTCGLDANGKAFCWGDNNIGQIGDGTMGNMRLAPTPVVTPLRFTEIQAGNSHTCALTREGKAFCWGNGVGIGQGTGADALSPTAVAGGITFRSISAKGPSTCGVSRADVVYCWGWNFYGGIGIGNTNTYVLVPTQVAP